MQKANMREAEKIRKVDPNTLLRENMRKVAAASEGMDPLYAAYMAGRLDGIVDAMVIKSERTA